jgi:hypothetical protein
MKARAHKKMKLFTKRSVRCMVLSWSFEGNGVVLPGGMVDIVTQPMIAWYI